MPVFISPAIVAEFHPEIVRWSFSTVLAIGLFGAVAMAADAPTTPTSAEGVEQQAGNTGTAAGPSGRVDPGPIDTSISALPSLWQRKATGGQNRMILLRPSRYPGQAPTSTSAGYAVPGSHIHRPGAHIADRVNAAVERQVQQRAERAKSDNGATSTNSLGIRKAATPSTGSGDNQRNANGAVSGHGGVGNPRAGIINHAAKNATGLTTQVHANAHGINSDDHTIAGQKLAVPLSRTASIGGPALAGVINARGAGRQSALGGPPKSVSGTLSGSDFRPKHQQN